MKLQESIDDLRSKEIFGEDIGYFDIIECQKRCRQHALCTCNVS